MKVLILTVTAGGGHNATASALKEEFELMGADVDVLDMYGAIGRPMKWLISKGYLISAERLKKIYAMFYRMFEKRHANSYKASTTRITNRLMSKNIRKYIEEYDPDAIVFTHVFCGGMLDVIKQKHHFRAKTFGIVTDFVMHPFWEEALRIDYIITANELMYPAAIHKGFLPSQIKPFGIPIKEKFTVSEDKSEARLKLGLNKDKRTVLFMGGSMGYGNVYKTVKHLDALEADIQIICVCGNNKKAKARIDGMKTAKRILNFGYVDNIDLLMDASDCIVSKPGGLTTSEAMAKRLPMIIFNPIPGQEERNAEFLQNNGVAMKVSDTYSMAYAIFQFFYSERKAELMKEAIDLIRKPDATKDVCRFVMEKTGGDLTVADYGKTDNEENEEDKKEVEEKLPSGV